MSVISAYPQLYPHFLGKTAGLPPTPQPRPTIVRGVPLLTTGARRALKALRRCACGRPRNRHKMAVLDRYPGLRVILPGEASCDIIQCCGPPRRGSNGCSSCANKRTSRTFCRMQGRTWAPCARMWRWPCATVRSGRFGRSSRTRPPWNKERPSGSGVGLPAKPHRDDEFLGTVGPGGRWLDIHHLGEALFQQFLQAALGPASKHLGHEGSALLQHVEGKIGSRLTQGDNTQVIGLLVTRARGSHVGHHDIRLPAQPIFHPVIRPLVEEIELVQVAAGDRFHFLQIDAQNGALALARLFT